MVFRDVNSSELKFKVCGSSSKALLPRRRLTLRHFEYSSAARLTGKFQVDDTSEVRVPSLLVSCLSHFAAQTPMVAVLDFGRVHAPVRRQLELQV